MTRDHPITGVGPDHFALAYGRYRTPEHTAREADRTPTRAHAELLHVAATYGVPGALAALGLALGAGASLRRASRRARDPAGRSAVGLLGAALLAFATSVSVGFHAVPTASLAVVLAGAAAGLAERGARAPTGGKFGPRALAAWGTAGLLAVPLVVLPLVGAVHARQAGALLHAAALDAARAAAERSVRWAPASPRGWALLARAREGRARFEPEPDRRRDGLLAARAAIERAVALEPADAHLRMLHAEILTALVRLDPPAADRAEALAALDAALAREPAYRPYLRGGLELALALDDPERAARIDARRRALYAP
jgi:hypothetical protein